MLNQGQGTYPQLAGSFYNSQQMMPHDNGRNARQVPTFFGGLQNMMSASSAMTNYQNIPLGQGILNTQALASHQYGRSVGSVIGGVGTGLGMAGIVGGVGAWGMGKAASAGMMPGVTSTLGRGLGALAGGALGATLAVGGVAALGVVHGYKKRMAAIDDMRNALEGSRMGYGLSDPVTGSISNQAAFNLSTQMESSALGSGFKNNDLKKIMGQASGLGMMNGMQSLSQVTKRVVDLAKASREIVELGEGISMTDAMNLQKMTQDMGISTSKFRGTNIGKNLVMAARAANMSMDQAAQVGGMGAMTYQQVGLGAAGGINAALHGSMAAAGLTGVGAFSQRQLASLGGQQGVAQNLLAGQASTMSRMSNALVMGAVKLDASGEFRMDRELLDQYVRGDRSREEMIKRGKDIGKGMSKGARSRLMEKLQFSMPDLRETMSDMLSSEEQMAIQARGVLELKNKTGMSMRRATHAYFQDAGQAESFLGYANNFGAVRDENNRQLSIAEQERMLRSAGRAKSSGWLSRGARAVAGAVADTGTFLFSGVNALGGTLAEEVARQQDDFNRGYNRIMSPTPTSSTSDLQSVGAYGSALYTTPTTRSPLERMGVGSYSEYYEKYGRHNIEQYERRTGQEDGVNRIGGGGIGKKIYELREGDYSPLRQIGDTLGLDFGIGAEDIYAEQARATDAAIQMGNIMQESQQYSNSPNSRQAYQAAVSAIRTVSINAADGVGSDGWGGVDSTDLYPKALLDKLGYNDVTKSETERGEIRAALGKAYKFVSRDPNKRAKDGFNIMTKRIGAAGGLELFMDNPKGAIDELRMGSGAVLKADGLSRAIHESGVSKDNLQKLLTSYSTGGQNLEDGVTKGSVQEILYNAGVTGVSERNLGKYRGLLKALESGQVTRTNAKGEEETASLAASVAEDLTLSKGEYEKAGKVYMGSQMEKLDKAIAVRLGGGKLREDLIGQLTTDYSDSKRGIKNTKAALEAEMVAAMRKTGTGRGISHQNMEDAKAEKQIELYKTQDELRDKWKLGYEEAGEEFRFSARGQDLTERMTRTHHNLQVLSGKVKDTHYMGVIQDRARGLAAKDKVKGMTEDDLAAARERLTENNKGGLLDFSSLTELFKNIGDGKHKDQYAKLLEGDAGAGLMTTFQDLRAGHSGLSVQQREKKLIQALMEVGKGKNISVPGVGQAKPLDALLTKISTGLDNFSNAMGAIARLKSENGEVTFKLMSKP